MRRRGWIVLTALTVAAALWATLRQGRPQPGPFTIDESLPAGAVRRIGSRTFGRVGGPNRPLVELSPDGARVYVCDDDGILRAWDVDRGAPLWQVAAHADAVPPAAGSLEQRLTRTWQAWSGAWHDPPRDLAVSPDGHRLATCAAAMIRVWEAASGQCLAERKVERDVDVLAWTADGRRLLRADKDRIAAWDVDGDAETSSEPFASEYLAFVARPDGTVAVQVESNPPSPVTLLDGATLARVAEIARPPDGWLQTLGFDGSGRELVAQWPKKPQERWSWCWLDPSTGALGDAFQTEGFLWRILEPERGRQVVVVGGLSALDVVRLADGGSTPVARGGATTEGASLTPDGRRIAWSALGRARVHDVAAGKRLHADEVLVDPGEFVVLPDGARVVAISEDASLVEIDLATGRVLRRFDVVGALQEGPFLSADGRYVAGRTSRGTFRVDLASGDVQSWQKWPAYFAFRGADVIGLEWSEQNLVVLDLAGGTSTPLEHGASASVGDVVFSDDGTRVRADLKSGTYVWDTVTGKSVEERVPTPPRLRLADAPRGGGQELVDVGPRRAHVALRDGFDANGTYPGGLAQGEALGTTLVAVAQNPTGSSARRTRVARIVLVAADDGRTVATLTAQDGPVVSLAFVPGGRRLLSGHGDGTILVWDLTALPPR